MRLRSGSSETSRAKKRYRSGKEGGHSVVPAAGLLERPVIHKSALAVHQFVATLFASGTGCRPVDLQMQQQRRQQSPRSRASVCPSFSTEDDVSAKCCTRYAENDAREI
jgi:hypothetical protein